MEIFEDILQDFYYLLFPFENSIYYRRRQTNVEKHWNWFLHKSSLWHRLSITSFVLFVVWLVIARLNLHHRRNRNSNAKRESVSNQTSKTKSTSGSKGTEKQAGENNSSNVIRISRRGSTQRKPSILRSIVNYFLSEDDWITGKWCSFRRRNRRPTSSPKSHEITERPTTREGSSGASKSRHQRELSASEKKRKRKSRDISGDKSRRSRQSTSLRTSDRQGGDALSRSKRKKSTDHSDETTAETMHTIPSQHSRLERRHQKVAARAKSPSDLSSPTDDDQRHRDNPVVKVTFRHDPPDLTNEHDSDKPINMEISRDNEIVSSAKFRRDGQLVSDVKFHRPGPTTLFDLLFPRERTKAEEILARYAKSKTEDFASPPEASRFPDPEFDHGKTKPVTSVTPFDKPPTAPLEPLPDVPTGLDEQLKPNKVEIGQPDTGSKGEPVLVIDAFEEVTCLTACMKNDKVFFHHDATTADTASTAFPQSPVHKSPMLPHKSCGQVVNFRALNIVEQNKFSSESEGSLHKKLSQGPRKSLTSYSATSVKDTANDVQTEDLSVICVRNSPRRASDITLSVKSHKRQDPSDDEFGQQPLQRQQQQEQRRRRQQRKQHRQNWPEIRMKRASTIHQPDTRKSSRRGGDNVLSAKPVTHSSSEDDHAYQRKLPEPYQRHENDFGDWRSRDKRPFLGPRKRGCLKPITEPPKKKVHENPIGKELVREWLNSYDMLEASDFSMATDDSGASSTKDEPSAMRKSSRPTRKNRRGYLSESDHEREERAIGVKCDYCGFGKKPDFMPHHDRHVRQDMSMETNAAHRCDKKKRHGSLKKKCTHHSRDIHEKPSVFRADQGNSMADSRSIMTDRRKGFRAMQRKEGWPDVSEHLGCHSPSRNELLSKQVQPPSPHGSTDGTEAFWERSKLKSDHETQFQDKNIERDAPEETGVGRFYKSDLPEETTDFREKQWHPEKGFDKICIKRSPETILPSDESDSEDSERTAEQPQTNRPEPGPLGVSSQHITRTDTNKVQQQEIISDADRIHPEDKYRLSVFHYFLKSVEAINRMYEQRYSRPTSAPGVIRRKGRAEKFQPYSKPDKARNKLIALPTDPQYLSLSREIRGQRRTSHFRAVASESDLSTMQTTPFQLATNGDCRYNLTTNLLFQRQPRMENRPLLVSATSQFSALRKGEQPGNYKLGRDINSQPSFTTQSSQCEITQPGPERKTKQAQTPEQNLKVPLSQVPSLSYNEPLNAVEVLTVECSDADEPEVMQKSHLDWKDRDQLSPEIDRQNETNEHRDDQKLTPASYTHRFSIMNKSCPNDVNQPFQMDGRQNDTFQSLDAQKLTVYRNAGEPGSSLKPYLDDNDRTPEEECRKHDLWEMLDAQKLPLVLRVHESDSMEKFVESREDQSPQEIKRQNIQQQALEFQQRPLCRYAETPESVRKRNTRNKEQSPEQESRQHESWQSLTAHKVPLPCSAERHENTGEPCQEEEVQPSQEKRRQTKPLKTQEFQTEPLACHAERPESVDKDQSPQQEIGQNKSRQSFDVKNPSLPWDTDRSKTVNTRYANDESQLRLRKSNPNKPWQPLNAHKLPLTDEANRNERMRKPYQIGEDQQSPQEKNRQNELWQPSNIQELPLTGYANRTESVSRSHQRELYQPEKNEQNERDRLWQHETEPCFNDILMDDPNRFKAWSPEEGQITEANIFSGKSSPTTVNTAVNTSPRYLDAQESPNQNAPDPRRSRYNSDRNDEAPCYLHTRKFQRQNKPCISKIPRYVRSQKHPSKMTLQTSVSTNFENLGAFASKAHRHEECTAGAHDISRLKKKHLMRPEELQGSQTQRPSNVETEPFQWEENVHDYDRESESCPLTEEILRNRPERPRMAKNRSRPMDSCQPIASVLQMLIRQTRQPVIIIAPENAGDVHHHSAISSGYPLSLEYQSHRRRTENMEYEASCDGTHSNIPETSHSPTRHSPLTLQEIPLMNSSHFDKETKEQFRKETNTASTIIKGAASNKGRAPHSQRSKIIHKEMAAELPSGAEASPKPDQTKLPDPSRSFHTPQTRANSLTCCELFGKFVMKGTEKVAQRHRENTTIKQTPLCICQDCRNNDRKTQLDENAFKTNITKQKSHPKIALLGVGKKTKAQPPLKSRAELKSNVLTSNTSLRSGKPLIKATKAAHQAKQPLTKREMLQNILSKIKVDKKQSRKDKEQRNKRIQPDSKRGGPLLSEEAGPNFLNETKNLPNTAATNDDRETVDNGMSDESPDQQKLQPNWENDPFPHPYLGTSKENIVPKETAITQTEPVQIITLGESLIHGYYGTSPLPLLTSSPVDAIPGPGLRSSFHRSNQSLSDAAVPDHVKKTEYQNDSYLIDPKRPSKSALSPEAIDHLEMESPAVQIWNAPQETIDMYPQSPKLDFVKKQELLGTVRNSTKEDTTKRQTTRKQKTRESALKSRDINAVKKVTAKQAKISTSQIVHISKTKKSTQPRNASSNSVSALLNELHRAMSGKVPCVFKKTGMENSTTTNNTKISTVPERQERITVSSGVSPTSKHEGSQDDEKQQVSVVHSSESTSRNADDDVKLLHLKDSSFKDNSTPFWGKPSAKKHKNITKGSYNTDNEGRLDGKTLHDVRRTIPSDIQQLRHTRSIPQRLKTSSSQEYGDLEIRSLAASQNKPEATFKVYKNAHMKGMVVVRNTRRGQGRAGILDPPDKINQPRALDSKQIAANQRNTHSKLRSSKNTQDDTFGRNIIKLQRSGSKISQQKIIYLRSKHHQKGTPARQSSKDKSREETLGLKTEPLQSSKLPEGEYLCDEMRRSRETLKKKCTEAKSPQVTTCVVPDQLTAVPQYKYRSDSPDKVFSFDPMDEDGVKEICSTRCEGRGQAFRQKEGEIQGRLKEDTMTVNDKANYFDLIEDMSSTEAEQYRLPDKLPRKIGGSSSGTLSSDHMSQLLDQVSVKHIMGINPVISPANCNFPRHPRRLTVTLDDNMQRISCKTSDLQERPYCIKSPVHGRTTEAEEPNPNIFPATAVKENRNDEPFDINVTLCENVGGTADLEQMPTEFLHDHNVDGIEQVRAPSDVQGDFWQDMTARGRATKSENIEHHQHREPAIAAHEQEVQKTGNVYTLTETTSRRFKRQRTNSSPATMDQRMAVIQDETWKASSVSYDVIERVLARKNRRSKSHYITVSCASDKEDIDFDPQSLNLLHSAQNLKFDRPTPFNESSPSDLARDLMKLQSRQSFQSRQGFDVSNEEYHYVAPSSPHSHPVHVFSFDSIELRRSASYTLIRHETASLEIGRSVMPPQEMQQDQTLAPRVKDMGDFREMRSNEKSTHRDKETEEFRQQTAGAVLQEDCRGTSDARKQTTRENPAMESAPSSPDIVLSWVSKAAASDGQGSPHTPALRADDTVSKTHSTCQSPHRSLWGTQDEAVSFVKTVKIGNGDQSHSLSNSSHNRSHPSQEKHTLINDRSGQSASTSRNIRRPRRNKDPHKKDADDIHHGESHRSNWSKVGKT